MNDCAFVGQNIVEAAGRAGLNWRILPPESTWARLRPGETTTRRSARLHAASRRFTAVARSQVVHVHFATTARLLHPRWMPQRPYVLHLHGTDIRSLWVAKSSHARIQTAIDRAAHVYYSTLDNAENALAARPDAEYMPVFVDPAGLPRWEPGRDGRYVVFTSRWEEVKGLEDMLRMARQLRAALPGTHELVGLDWGPGSAAAAEAGVRLVPAMPHAEFLRLLAGADLAIGQARPILSVSEIEAMAIGVPLAAAGPHLPGPDGNDPPILTGSIEQTAEQVVAGVADPAATAAALGGREWALTEHTADRQVPRLRGLYERLAAR